MIINGIDTKDISFVVQGSIDLSFTKQCLESIRSNFPEATIILSTWKNEKINELEYDKLVLSDDPGTCVYSVIPEYNNINRQFISTIAGLKKVSTKYTAKVRSDLIFESPAFLQYFNKFTKYDEKYKRVKYRMIILSMYTRIVHIGQSQDGNLTNRLANYHPSDWFFFGDTEDVYNYFNMDMLLDIKKFSRYYFEHEKEREQIPYFTLMAQNTPEQYFGSHFFGLDYKKETIGSLSQYSQIDSIKNLINNFVVLDREYSKIYSGKWKSLSYNEWDLQLGSISIMFYGEYLKYYKRYCDKSFIIPGDIDKKIFKKKMKIIWDNLWWNKTKQYCCKKILVLKKYFEFVKKIMKIIFPAYRTSVGIRERLIRFEGVEQDRFNYLVYRISILSDKQKEDKKEFRKLKKELLQYNKK